MLKDLGKGLFGRLLSSGILALGFWLMYQAFQRSSATSGTALAFLAAVVILCGLYLMVKARRTYPPQILARSMDQEEEPVDTSDGSDKGDKLPS